MNVRIRFVAILLIILMPGLGFAQPVPASVGPPPPPKDFLNAGVGIFIAPKPNQSVLWMTPIVADSAFTIITWIERCNSEVCALASQPCEYSVSSPPHEAGRQGIASIIDKQSCKMPTFVADNYRFCMKNADLLECSNLVALTLPKAVSAGFNEPSRKISLLISRARDNNLYLEQVKP